MENEPPSAACTLQPAIHCCFSSGVGGAGSSGGSKKRARQDSKSGQPGKSGKSGGKHARGQQGSSSQPHSSQQGGGGSVSSNTLEYGGYDNLSSEVEHDLDVGDDEGRVQASQRFLATAKEVMPEAIVHSGLSCSLRRWPPRSLPKRVPPHIL